jgi:peroxidase
MQVGGPSWTVEYGRRDGVTANITLANEELPSALNSGPQLQSNFESKGFNLQQMVALSGKTSAADAKGGNFLVFSPIELSWCLGLKF